ncbi:MAG: hypothetical protein ACPGFA_04590 [Pikeienuella sp.]
MSPYLTSAIIGGAVMFALQMVGLGFANDDDFGPPDKGAPAVISIARQ